MPNVLITLNVPNATIPVSVNGNARDVPTGKPVNVTDEEYEVLRNSSIHGMSMQVLPDETAAQEPAEIKPGLRDGEPATPAAISPGTGPGDPEREGEPSGEPEDSFDAAKFVDRTLDEIGEDLDELDAQQLDAVIDAEKNRQDADGNALPERSTLIDRLEAKKAKLADSGE